MIFEIKEIHRLLQAMIILAVIKLAGDRRSIRLPKRVLHQALWQASDYSTFINLLIDCTFERREDFGWFCRELEETLDYLANNQLLDWMENDAILVITSKTRLGFNAQAISQVHLRQIQSLAEHLAHDLQSDDL